MDPVSAFGIAAAVAQFADFGFRLIKSAHELYKSPSGQAPEYIELSRVSVDLLRLVGAIKMKFDENQGLAGEIFLRLHDECQTTNDELKRILDRLKARGSTKIALAADGLKVAFRQVAAAGDIEKLAHRLDRIRQQINVGLLHTLVDEAGKNGVELRQCARQQADIIAALDQIDSTTKKLCTDIIDFIDGMPKYNRIETDEMVRYVLSDKWEASEYAKKSEFDKSRDKEKLQKLRQSLYFESISHRETSIPKRHSATFEWIFQEPRTSEDGHALWSAFPLWLRGESSDIYWITGKPGAGKSTLVKFVSQDRRFETLLKEWAAESQLLIARFFSWTSGGNKLQKSQEGLFRTLLFEAIQQRPQLAIEIFPARWFLLQSFDGNIKLPALTTADLRVGFQNLLSVAGDKMKLVLLIDGLDEFDDDRHESHRDLVHLLRDAKAMPGVKICASSRPWNVFRDEYSKNPMLQLEKLTREDIKAFVKEKLQLSPGYDDFATTNSQAACKIITDIVDKSQGVFLWVSVISGLLETALQEGTSISDLQATIDNLPSEVADLFRYIWNRTSNQFRAQASQYFRLMRTCQDYKTNLFALTLWFGDKDFPVDFKTADATIVFLEGVIKSLERKLMSRTGGLLELVSSNGDHTKIPKDVHVYYMHRTANDWVSENWESISSATDPGFDPLFWFVKGEALSVVLATKPTTGNLKGLRDWQRVFDIASLVPEDHSDKGILATAFDRLNDHIISHMGKYPGSSGVHWFNWLELNSHNQSQLTNTHRVGSITLSDTNFLELSARVPIPAYLKHKAQEDPDLFSTADYCVGILNNAILGEIWFRNPVVRLALLDFLIQEKYNHRPEWLRRAKEKVEDARLFVRGTYSRDHYIVTYLTQAIRKLESRIPPTDSQAGQNRSAISGDAKIAGAAAKIANAGAKIADAGAKTTNAEAEIDRQVTGFL
ncbi:hypothetical protein TrVGV298_002183 [Trichoderma virens]|nr:hypothetical protein TrVGV298_002183 [Trichoderma virens]